MNKNKLFSILAAITICSVTAQSAVLTQQSNPSGLVVMVTGSTIAANGSLSISSAASSSLTVVPNIFINNGNGNIGIKTSSPTVTFEVNGHTQINGRLKVLNTAVFASSIASLGVADGTNVDTGYVGEYISDVGIAGAVGASGSYTHAIATITLSAGDWEVSGGCALNTGGTTATTQMTCAISNSTTATDITTLDSLTAHSLVMSINSYHYMSVGPRRINISASTTYYLIPSLTYSVLGGASYAGTDSILRARRVR